MNWSESFRGFRFFWKGLQAANREMWVSIQVLLILTLALSVLLYVFEHMAQPDVYGNLWDSIVWSFMGYLGNPGKFSPSDPITFPGRLIWIIIAVIKILIFAIPAGLVANGFRAAMEKDKRQKKLAVFRKKLRKSFRRAMNRNLREYLNTLPDKGGKKYSKLNFVPSMKPVALIQATKGMSLQDITDTVNTFPEFRMKNKATAMSDEDNPDDRFLIEHFPINRSYGCCIDRGSKVTIISTSSVSELGTGWFLYYLAKLGGFNYISKELEVDMDEVDSFFNVSDEPLYDKKPHSAYNDVKKHMHELEVIDQKQQCRKAFFKDIQTLATNTKTERPWLILCCSHIKNNVNTSDFHFTDKDKKNANSTIIDQEAYEKLFALFAQTFEDDMALSTVKSTRYPHTEKNLFYYLKKHDYLSDFNGFVLRPSSEIVAFDSRRLVIAFRMARCINEVLCPDGGIREKDFEGLGSGFGYQEQQIDDADVRDSIFTFD